MSFNCSPPVDCPGSDLPIVNYSSETPDKDVFIGMAWGPSDNNDQDPTPGQTWSAPGCISTCESAISQEDADLCALRQATQCAITDRHNPDGTVPPVFQNSTQTCVVQCPDGLPFSWTVPNGVFVGLSQALVDRMAQSLACNLARQKRECLSALTLTAGCKGSSFSASVSANGQLVTPITWQVVSGALPPGLTLGGFSPNVDVTTGVTETIQGIPINGGTFTFTLRATTENGVFMQKQYTICIIGISPNALPAMTSGTAFSQQLTVNGCGTATKWVVSSGSLPPGITLNPTTGLLSGTPTNSGNFTFTISVTATV